jgi:hypothetical protein
MAHINKAAPILLGYQTYATFHKTSMEDKVPKLEYSMPMTLYFAICKYLCQNCILIASKTAPDVIITTFVLSVFIGSIFGIIATQTCFNISIYSVWKFSVAAIKATIRHTDKPIDFASADNNIRYPWHDEF